MFDFFSKNNEQNNNNQAQAQAQAQPQPQRKQSVRERFPDIASGLPSGRFNTDNLDLVVENFAPNTVNTLREARDNSYISIENQKVLNKNLGNLSDDLKNTFDGVAINKENIEKVLDVVVKNQAQMAEMQNKIDKLTEIVNNKTLCR